MDTSHECLNGQKLKIIDIFDQRLPGNRLRNFLITKIYTEHSKQEGGGRVD